MDGHGVLNPSPGSETRFQLRTRTRVSEANRANWSNGTGQPAERGQGAGSSKRGVRYGRCTLGFSAVFFLLGSCYNILFILCLGRVNFQRLQGLNGGRPTTAAAAAAAEASAATVEIPKRSRSSLASISVVCSRCCCCCFG